MRSSGLCDLLNLRSQVLFFWARPQEAWLWSQLRSSRVPLIGAVTSVGLSFLV